MIRPKVSIIIPVYGVEEYIERCTRSLFEQTLKELEYIFIDDCTPDKSIDVLKNVLGDYPERKSQVVIHKMKKNSGQAAVRKWGMENAKGEYIIHCDSDDYVEKTAYEVLYKKAKEKDYDLVFCNYYVQKNNVFVIKQRNIKPNDTNWLIREALIGDTLNQLWAVLVKRSLLRELLIYPTGNQSEDKTIMIQLCCNVNMYYLFQTPLYYYCDNPNSISNQRNIAKIIKRYKDIEQNRYIILKYLQEKELLYIYQNEVNAYLFLAKSILYQGLNDIEVRRLWTSSFKEVNKNFFVNPYISLKEKIRFLVMKTGFLCFNIFQKLTRVNDEKND